MTTEKSLKIGIVISTTRPSRKGRIIADWLQAQIPQKEGVEYEIIDLSEVNLPFLNESESPASGKYQHEHTKKWSEKVKSFDGFIFVTAEYNNGPPAPLKNAIDCLYHEWDKKPVAFVGYGTYGATRAVEQLVNIAAKIGMVPLPKTFVSVVKPWDAVADDGHINSDFVMGNLDGLLNNLLWWAELLKPKR